MEIKNISTPEEQAHIHNIIEEVKICMCCIKEQKKATKVRPVGTSRMNDDGSIWFLCNKEHYEDNPIKTGSLVELIYSEPGQSHLLTVYGASVVERNHKMVRLLWGPQVNEWFTGKDDPNILLIKIIPAEAYYWDTTLEHMVALVRLAAAA